MARTTPAELSLEPFLSRPLFVHDYNDEVASLLFEIRGRGTALLADEDAGLLVSAPLGRGFAVDSGPVALVGGGVWVSPLKLLSRRLSEVGILHDVFLEIPSTAPTAYAEWIRENYLGAILVPTHESPSSPQEVLSRVGCLGCYHIVYASGPTEMLAAVKSVSEDKVLAQLALRASLACANGSCYGCAIPVWDETGKPTYARACIDGPVFPAEAIRSLE
jgi:dihydroorotate dehydrogenase electron transfer subunit